jgi:hypothetical protein
MTLFLACLIVPGLLVTYALFLRPVLHAIPALKKFYTDADGFWAKVSALGGHSATIAWGYFMAALGFATTWVGPLGTAIGDPELKNQITSMVQGNPAVLGYVTMAISAITIAARLRSIAKG